MGELAMIAGEVWKVVSRASSAGLRTFPLAALRIYVVVGQVLCGPNEDPRSTPYSVRKHEYHGLHSQSHSGFWGDSETVDPPVPIHGFWDQRISMETVESCKSQQLGRVVDRSQLRNWWLSDKQFPEGCPEISFFRNDSRRSTAILTVDISLSMFHILVEDDTKGARPTAL
ncbi:predicted protein [Coccidioides posadasii str. Silveira]|uniref:Predicted protein n=1 Tax=Coccidioides posadasii (strain RMSCC 757 / Silveira) TaxID=443226 RepID=E9DE13_COCPS|nr:predicted protein [Coccidioides posadasii str. Silveira]